MSDRASFSLGKALSAAGSFVPKAVGGAWLVLILLWAVSVFGAVAGVHAMRHHVQALSHHLHGPVHLFVMLVLLALSLAATGAVYRIALFGEDAKAEGLGFGGLQFAMPELRLFGAKIVVGLFILAIAATLVIVFAMLFSLLKLGAGYDTTRDALAAMLSRHSTAADFSVIAYMVLSVIFLIFVALKFVFAHAATVAERRMVTLNALGLSAGNVGKVVIGLLTILIPFLFVWVILLHLYVRHVMTSFMTPGTGHLLQHQLIFHGVLHLLLIFVVLPLCAGFLASAYQQIVGARRKTGL